MFDWIFGKRTPRAPLPTFEDYAAAGVLFTDDRFVLAAWQPHKTIPKLSGIGGLREGAESYSITALREMVEELYGCAEVPVTLLQKLLIKFHPRTVFKNHEYVNLVYTFKDLEKMLQIINKSGIKSYYYKTLPKTVLELVFNRQKSVTAEVEAFALLPVGMFRNGCIDPNFESDVKMGIL